MIRRLFIGILWGVPAYIGGSFAGGFMLFHLAAAGHDGSIEAAVTGAFVFGPVAALAALIAGFIWAGKPRAPRIVPPARR